MNFAPASTTGLALVTFVAGLVCVAPEPAPAQTTVKRSMGNMTRGSGTRRGNDLGSSSRGRSSSMSASRSSRTPTLPSETRPYEYEEEEEAALQQPQPRDDDVRGRRRRVRARCRPNPRASVHLWHRRRDRLPAAGRSLQGRHTEGPGAACAAGRPARTRRAVERFRVAPERRRTAIEVRLPPLGRPPKESQGEAQDQRGMPLRFLWRGALRPGNERLPERHRCPGERAAREPEGSVERNGRSPLIRPREAQPFCEALHGMALTGLMACGFTSGGGRRAARRGDLVGRCVARALPVRCAFPASCRSAFHSGSDAVGPFRRR